MTDVRSRLERALATMAGRPGVSIAPPASPEMLDRAEQRLGRPLPPDLRELLSLANGMSVEYGLTRILGVERDDSPDLIDFNDYDNWKYAWPSMDLRDCLVFRLTYNFDFAAYRSDGTLIEGMLPLEGSLEPARIDLVSKIERGWVGMATRPLDPGEAEVHRAVGKVPPDQGVYLGTKWFLTAEADPPEFRLQPLEQVLRMSGGLNADADALPPDTLVVAPFCEHDEFGRERWRWITARDLPGLAEQAGPGTVVSHITIDGQIPGHDDA